MSTNRERREGGRGSKLPPGVGAERLLERKCGPTANSLGFSAHGFSGGGGRETAVAGQGGDHWSSISGDVGAGDQ